MRFALNELPAHMREQAQAKLAAAGGVRYHSIGHAKRPSVRRPSGKREEQLNPTTITHDNRTQTVEAWAKETGINARTLRYRIKSGYSSTTILSKVAHKRKPVIPRLSEPEERLAFHLKAEGLGGFVRQYPWCPGRRFRADFAYLGPKLLVEVQGGIHSNGAHVRGRGYERDRARNNEAVILGYRMLEFTPGQIKSGLAVRSVKRALEGFRT